MSENVKFIYIYLHFLVVGNIQYTVYYILNLAVFVSIYVRLNKGYIGGVLDYDTQLLQFAGENDAVIFATNRAGLLRSCSSPDTI